MKRIVGFSLLVCPMLALSSCGCAGDGESSVTSSKPEFETVVFDEMTLDYYEEWGGYCVSDYKGEKDSISIPETVTDSHGNTAPVTRINDNAFYGRDKVAKVQLSKNVVSIGNNAFEHTGLTKLVVTPSLYDVGTNIYANTPFVPYSEDGLSYLESETSHHCVLIGGVAASTFVFPEDLSSISVSGAFVHVSFSEPIEAPNITYICDSAFEGVNLVSFLAGENLTAIGKNAFKGCEAVSLDFSASSKLLSVGDYAFSGCKKLETLRLPEAVEKMGQDALFECNALTELALPFVGPNAQEGKTYKEYCNTAATVSTKLNLTIYKGKIAAHAFTSIDYMPYIIVESLSLVHVDSVGQEAFALKNKWADYLVSLSLGDSLTLVSYSAFFLGSYQYVYIPSSVILVYSQAFYTDQSVILELGRTRIDGMYDPYQRDLTYCNSSNATIRYGVKESRAVYGEYQYNVTSGGSAVIAKYFGKDETVVVPDKLGAYDVLWTYPDAFADCSFIKKLSLPKLNCGDAGTLRGLTNLEELEIRDASDLYATHRLFGDVEFPGSYSIEHTETTGVPKKYYVPSSLKTLKVQGKTAHFDLEAFAGYASLTSLTVDAKQLIIRESAFSGCANLEGELTITKQDTFDKSSFRGTKVRLIFERTDWYEAYILNYPDRAQYCSALPKEIVTEGDYEYYLDDHDDAVICGYIGNGGDVSVPSKAGGVGIVRIEADVFVNNTAITSLTFENSSVGKEDGCFAGMRNLEKLVFTSTDMSPGSLIRFFEQDETYERFGSNNAKPREGYVFCYPAKADSAGNVSLDYSKRYYVPESLKEISFGRTSQLACAGLTPVEKVSVSSPAKSYSTTIPNGLFYGCTELKEVEIGEGFTSVEPYAFYGCDSLETVALPSSVETIERNAFNRSGLVHIDLPSGVKTIKGAAFGNCSKLLYLELKSSIETIDSTAFTGCPNLVLVCEPSTKPAGWKFTSSNAIYGSSLERVESYALLSSDGHVTLLGIPDDVTEITLPMQIGSYTVDSVSMTLLEGLKDRLTSISLGEGSNLIGTLMFQGYSVLSSLSIGIASDSVSVEGCAALKQIKVSGAAGSLSIKECAALENVEITGATGSLAIADCPELTTLSLASCQETIDDKMLSNLPKLTALVIPESVTTIKEEALKTLTGLEKIYIPDSVTTIGSYILDNGNADTVIYCEAASQPSGYTYWWKLYSVEEDMGGWTYSHDESHIVKWGATIADYEQGN